MIGVIPRRASSAQLVDRQVAGERRRPAPVRRELRRGARRRRAGCARLRSARATRWRSARARRPCSACAWRGSGPSAPRCGGGTAGSPEQPLERSRDRVSPTSALRADRLDSSRIQSPTGDLLALERDSAHDLVAGALEAGTAAAELEGLLAERDGDAPDLARLDRRPPTRSRWTLVSSPSDSSSVLARTSTASEISVPSARIAAAGRLRSRCSSLAIACRLALVRPPWLWSGRLTARHRAAGAGARRRGAADRVATPRWPLSQWSRPSVLFARQRTAHRVGSRRSPGRTGRRLLRRCSAAGTVPRRASSRPCFHRRHWP